MPAFAADAETWMNNLAKAGQSHSYSGTFVYGRDGSFSSHALWHRVEGKGVRERLLQLDGPAVEVVRVDGRVECSTEAFARDTEGRGWQDANFDAKALSQWYEYRLIGDSRVADRPTVAIAVLARDQHRYSFELHLDRETGFAVKSLMLSEKGQLLERLQFTNFEVGAIAPTDLQPRSECKALEVPQLQKQAATWRADWLPPGFRLLDSSLAAGDSKAPVTFLSYGDGLARFSVFIEPLQGEQVHDARSQMGPTVIVSKRISAAGGDVMVTVVGEVPLGTAERVALSVRDDAEKAGQ